MALIRRGYSVRLDITYSPYRTFEGDAESVVPRDAAGIVLPARAYRYS